MSIRTVLNPMPTIPLLGPDNAIDLDSLGSSDLPTFVNYLGISDGDTIIVNWFGCGPNGEIVDKFNDEVQVLDEDLTPDGMPVMIENSIMKLLRNGSVFYAYQVKKPGGTPGDASLRLFFYVGKRPRTSTVLPVLQIRESHDLHLDLNEAPPIIKPWMVPYQAMAVGDVITLHCRRYNPDGSEYTPALAYPREVKDGEAGQTLDLFLNRSDLLRVEDGTVELYYGIQYIDTPQEITLSSRQTFTLSAPTTATLPALTIVGHDGGTINPALFPDGVRLRIEGYPGMSVGDELLLHASSDADDVEPVVLRASIDASTLDKGFIELPLSAQWLAASQGAAIDLRYEYAWAGTALSASPYQANVREPLNLPMVIVEGALPDPDKPVEGEGVLDVLALSSSGVTIHVDPDANFGSEDQVVMHWDGYGVGGKHSVTSPGGRTFNIPAHYIPANFGKSVQVYYTVLQTGEPAPAKSEVFVVKVLPIEKSRYPVIQSYQAQQYNGTIYMGRMAAGGELFTLRAWPYMREGQTVNAFIHGKNANDDPLIVPVFENHTVVSAEITARQIAKSVLPASFQPFKLGSINVQVTITYEAGAETQYAPANFVLDS